MWSTWSSAARGTEPRRLPALLVALVLAAGLLAGCQDDDEPSGTPVDPGISTAQAMRTEQRILGQRARAVRSGNLALFLRHVDRSDRGLVSRQRRYFRNLQQLPIQRFGYKVLPAQWTGLALAPDWGEDVRIPKVRVSLQLEGYDAVPVRRIIGFVFSHADGRAAIVSDQTRDGERLAEGPLAPWDITAITVREAPGVLAVLDRRTRSSADAVTAAVSQGMGDLEDALPFDWDGRVVVYHVGSTRVLSSFTDVPGGVITHLGAMTFPEYATARRDKVASTRMLLLPSSVRAGQPFLGRISRHELSHVAIGSRDDGVPTWVSEGLAEYLGARPVPAGRRIIPTSALAEAQGQDLAMPASKGFNGAEQEWNYALSWMAFDLIAQTRGEGKVWELVEAMHDGGRGTRDRAQDAVLFEVLGMDNRELARQAAARIRSIYG